MGRMTGSGARGCVARTAVYRALALLVVLVLLSLYGATAGAQGPVMVEAAADRPSARIGDRITYTITITAAPDVQVTAPGDTQAFGPFDILERRSPQERTLPDGRRELRVTFVVAPFRATGVQTLVAPPVAYSLPDGTASQAPVPGLAVTVESILPDQTPGDIRGLKPQLSVPGAPARWPSYGAAAAVMLALLGAGAFLVRRRLRRRPLPAAPPVPLLPEDIARRELDEIAALPLVDQEDFRVYHHRIAGVVRRYLTARYGFPGFAWTTTELQHSMIEHGVDRWQARLVSGLLRECDAIVYAGYLPARARADANLTAAYEIVELTRQQPDAVPRLERNGKVGAA